MSTFEMQSIATKDLLLITAEDFAALLSISTRTLWRKRSAGEIPQPIRVGVTVRWRLEEVRKWIIEGCPFPQARENERRRK
jgi:predicted DNA-binding transcriptional regulator AlpA